MPDHPSKILETTRLILRTFSPEDAEFTLQLVSDPAWLEHIGDRNVRTLEDASAYIRRGAMTMYERLGFSIYVVTLKTGEPIGSCGLVKRETLQDVDIGFAFLSQFRGQGYALEAAQAVLEHARSVLGLNRVVAHRLACQPSLHPHPRENWPPLRAHGEAARR